MHNTMINEDNWQTMMAFIILKTEQKFIVCNKMNIYNIIWNTLVHLHSLKWGENTLHIMTQGVGTNWYIYTPKEGAKLR